MLAPILAWYDLPFKVTKGRPIRRASLAVAPALQGLVSKNMKLKIIAELSALKVKRDKLDNECKALLKNKSIAYHYPGMDNYKGMNIYDIFHANFQYLGPVNFEEMIGKWEDACKSVGCNYMAVEYPEFASPGGYQMAINAKPMFILTAMHAALTR